jgi:hypothetical protein
MKQAQIVAQRHSVISFSKIKVLYKIIGAMALNSVLSLLLIAQKMQRLHKRR